MSEEFTIQTKAEAELIEQIKATYAESVSLAESAKVASSLAVNKALECGNHLISAKESVGHGKWMSWFSHHSGNHLISAKAAVGHGRWLSWFRNHGFVFSGKSRTGAVFVAIE